MPESALSSYPQPHRISHILRVEWSSPQFSYCFLPSLDQAPRATVLCRAFFLAFSPFHRPGGIPLAIRGMSSYFTSDDTVMNVIHLASKVLLPVK